MELTRILGGIVFFALLHNPVPAAQSVALAWDKSPDLSAVGYNIYFGAASGTYTNKIDAGNATNRTISGLIEGTMYYFTATAYNSTGLESVFSNEIGYTVPVSNNLPTITLTSPANGASYPAPATINLAASVTANGQTITKVQFYNGAALLGEDTAAPYTYTWSNVIAGGYALTTRAVYGSGSTVASSPANVTVVTVNTAPTISDIVNQTIGEDTSTAALSFTVADAEAAAGSLTVGGSSSNPTLVPNGNIVFGGSGANRTVSVTPAANQSGSATITVTVSDGSMTGADTFVLAVNALNDAPTMGAIADQSTSVNTATAGIPFTVGDMETAAGSLTPGGSSSNQALVPNANIVFGGSGASRTVMVTPAANQTGTATITVTVSDGALTASDTFVLTVNASNPAPTVALTAPLSGASYPAPANITLAASLTANGQTISKVQFYTGTTLLGEDTSSPYSIAWNNVVAGSYSLTARAVYGAGSTANSSPVNIDVAGLPAPWQTADVGSVGAVGSASVSNGIYTVKGAGNISGTADNFHFVYQSLSGNGEIKVRLTSVANASTGGRIGILIRESLISGSKYAFMGISADGIFRWQRRGKTDGPTGVTTSTIGTPPNTWVRLVRTGSTLDGYRSIDGITWTLVNSRNITMGTTIYVGLGVASGNSTTLSTTTFSNLAVVP